MIRGCWRALVWHVWVNVRDGLWLLRSGVQHGLRECGRSWSRIPIPFVQNVRASWALWREGKIGLWR